MLAVHIMMCMWHNNVLVQFRAAFLTSEMQVLDLEKPRHSAILLDFDMCPASAMAMLAGLMVSSQIQRAWSHLPFFGGSFASKALELSGRALSAFQDHTCFGNVKLAPQTIAEAGHSRWKITLGYCFLALLCCVCNGTYPSERSHGDHDNKRLRHAAKASNCYREGARLHCNLAPISQ